jgi:hypothetical protein
MICLPAASTALGLLVGPASVGHATIGGGNIAAQRFVRGGLHGGDLPGIRLAVDRGPAFQVLTVQPFYELASWLLALIVGMVAITERELAVRGGMLPDPPAARMMRVLLDQAAGNPDADASPQCTGERAAPPMPAANTEIAASFGHLRAGPTTGVG